MNSVRLPARFTQTRVSLVCICLTMFMVQAVYAIPQSGSRTQLVKSQTATKVKLPELIATGQKSFEIPFSLNASQSSVVEVVLQMSTDQGKTWQEHSRRSPGSTAFPFSSPQDREFWFAIQTVNQDGQMQPTNQSLKPELRIAIDTTKPQLAFEVRPDAAGRIVGVWTAVDENIDPCSMVIQYQSESSTDDNWYTVPSQTCSQQTGSTYRDQLAWWPQTTARNLRIRAGIKDLAGNEAVVDRTMLVPLTAGIRSGAPTGNHLRGNSQQQVTQNRIQLNQSPGTQQSQTNYQRSRLPFALSQQYGNSPPSPTQPTDNQGQQQPAPSPDQSSIAPATAVKPINAGYRQSNLSGVPTPQPPQSQSNRFASNQVGNTRPMPRGTSPPSTTRWRSRTNGSAGSQVTEGTTDVYRKPAPPTEVRVASNQDYYGSSSSNTSSNLQPSNTQQDSQQERSSATSRGSSLNRTADPMRPQAPFIPGPSQFASDNNSGNSNQSANGQWISSTTGISQRPDPIPSSALATGPELESLRRSARPSSSKRFQLDYDIDAIGPEGVKEVELWVTRDGGNSWRRLTTDQDRRSPVNVAVESEGIFGFRILVISNEGLRARQPRSGDPADMWVNVDTTKPSVQITAVPYGRGQDAGRLLVQWRASDTNLKLRPAKLSYSSGPQGPWTTIEDGIRNEGQYAWKPGADIPDKVYLQLELRDTAGNVGTHRLNRPIDVSGLIPRGHIRGITPIREIPDGDAPDVNSRDTNT